jgi:hypothetical protein
MQTLEERFELHKMTEKGERKTRLYRHYDEIGWENVEISLIKEEEVEEGQEMLIYETQYIEKYLKDENCLNSRISFDYHHLWLNKREFQEFPGELIVILNRLHKICEKSGEKSVKGDSIFVRSRYEKVKRVKDLIKRQFEMKKKVMKEIVRLGPAGLRGDPLVGEPQL